MLCPKCSSSNFGVIRKPNIFHCYACNIKWTQDGGEQKVWRKIFMFAYLVYPQQYSARHICQLAWYDCPALTGYKRVPFEDKEIEVEE
jgi:hypothetical protein